MAPHTVIPYDKKGKNEHNRQILESLRGLNAQVHKYTNRSGQLPR